MNRLDPADRERAGSPARRELTAGTYVLVWLALMILAALTFLLSRAHLGSLDIAIALVIAVIKTVLVVLFFMELIEHRFVNSMVLIVTAGFVVLLISLTVADVVTRHTFPKGPLPAATEIPMSLSPPSRPSSNTPD
jgi:cytochrome c oxidase subunit 4